MIEFLFAVISGALGVSLYARGRRKGEVAILVFAGAFVSLALAWLMSGVVREFAAELGGGGLEATFRFAALMVGLASFCLAAGVALACSIDVWRRLLLGLIALKLVLCSFWIATAVDERVVLWDLTIALLLVMILEVGALVRSRAKSAPWMLAGAVLSLGALSLRASASAGTPLAGISIDAMPIFYNGLALVATVVLHQGGLHLHDRIAWRREPEHLARDNVRE